MTLKHLLLQEIENRDKTSVSELVAISGYSNLQNFKRVLTSDREFDKLQCLIDVVEYIWPDEVLRIIAQYSFEIDPNKKIARCMLERLSTSRNMEAFKALLNRMENCSNKESREFAKVYSVQYEYQANHNVDLDEMIKFAKSHKTKIVELQVFLKLMKTYAYNQKGVFYMTKLLADEIYLYIDEMENGYLKDMYTARACETMSYVELRVFNNPEEARKYADQIISSPIGKAFKAYAKFIKGYSYFFSSFEQSLHYFNESVRLYKEMDREWIVNDLEEKVELLKVFHDRLEKPECRYLTSYFLLNIKNGVNVSKLLDEKKDELEEPMYLYLKGKAENSLNHLAMSLLKFIKKGDSFLSNLPKQELIKMGYNEEILNELVSIRVS